jgi:hypothetical protein
MTPIALCKTWRGKEFLIPAIEAIYPHMEKLVFVHSDIAWTGEKGNNIRTPLLKWTERWDKENKIISIDYDSRSQDAQYWHGLNFIMNSFPETEWSLFFDTDEVWDEKEILALIDRSGAVPSGIAALSCGMYTYLKSPFYRVEPAEPCHPIVLYRLSSDTFAGARGSLIPPRLRMKCEDIYFHHFTYVRDSEEELFRKIRQIYEAEKDAYGHVDLDKWKAEKWDALPLSTDLHTAADRENYWKGIKVIGEADLPEVLQGTKLLEKWKKAESFRAPITLAEAREHGTGKPVDVIIKNELSHCIGFVNKCIRGNIDNLDNSDYPLPFHYPHQLTSASKDRLKGLFLIEGFEISYHSLHGDIYIRIAR